MEKATSDYRIALERLRSQPKVWLVTGVAGFIGSNLLQHLLENGQTVIGLDNFSNGRRENLNEVRDLVGPSAWQRFDFIEGDIRDLDECRRAMKACDYVLHQAALGSVPRSLENPIATNESNVTGFLNILVAARETKIQRLVYASSSSVYGDDENMPKLEDSVGHPLSPYAVSKRVNELYGRVFHMNFGLPVIGLRYFNVFGARQKPDGPYAAVIPKWIAALCNGERPVIYGDGSLSRDFCYIRNVLQMNLLAATSANSAAFGRVYNVALNARISLVDLHIAIETRFKRLVPDIQVLPPVYKTPRQGEIFHSQADISAGRKALGYDPEYDVLRGLDESLPWYVSQHVSPVLNSISERLLQAEKHNPDIGAIARDV